MASPPATSRRRVGVVDLGSNAIRTAIVELDAAGATVVESGREPVRLGTGASGRCAIGAERRAAAIAVLEQFARRCAELGVATVRAVATEAVRAAEDAAEFVAAVRDRTGIALAVLSGEQEARLLIAAVTTRLDLANGRTVVTDLGGGSLEVVLVDDGAIRWIESASLGTLRLLDALGPGGPTKPVAAIAAVLTRSLAPLTARIAAAAAERPVDRMVAAGGNVDTLATLIGTAPVPLAGLERIAAALAPLAPDERARAHTLPPNRADTIVVAAVAHALLARAAGTGLLHVPGVGLRDGLIATAAGGLP